MTGINELSEREQEILRLVATGASNKEIAQQLSISANTVKVHLRNIFGKIGANSRTEAAMYAVNAGLVQTIPPQSGTASFDTPKPEFAPEELEAQPAPARTPPAAGWWIALVIILLMAGAAGLAAARNRQAALFPAPSSATATIPPRWQEMKSMSIQRTSLAAAVFESQLYAIAGQTVTGPTGDVEVYNPETDQWEFKQAKPVPVSEVSAVVVGGKIYVPGGRLASGECTDALAVYDPREDQWTTAARLPAKISAYALAAFEGKIYLFGGRDGDRYFDTVFEYNPEADTWSERAPMKTARAYAGAAVAGGRIFVVGGYAGKDALVENEVFQPDRQDNDQPWSSAAPLPKGRYGMAVASVADIVLVVGGVGDADGALTHLEYFSQFDTWEEMEPVNLEGRCENARLVPIGTQLHLIGCSTNAEPTAQHLVYQALFTTVFPVVR